MLQDMPVVLYLRSWNLWKSAVAHSGKHWDEWMRELDHTLTWGTMWSDDTAMASYKVHYEKKEMHSAQDEMVSVHWQTHGVIWVNVQLWCHISTSSWHCNGVPSQMGEEGWGLKERGTLTRMGLQNRCLNVHASIFISELGYRLLWLCNSTGTSTSNISTSGSGILIVSEFGEC